MPNNNPNFPNFQALLDYIKATPAWLLGFVDGEGCFTASFMLYTKGTWGITPQCEFNVTQSSQDSILLDAINAFFGLVGTVHHKIGGVSVVAFRSISALYTVIIPFFLKVRTAKLLEIIRRKPVMDVDLHKPTYKCVISNN